MYSPNSRSPILSLSLDTNSSSLEPILCLCPSHEIRWFSQGEVTPIIRVAVSSVEGGIGDSENEVDTILGMEYLEDLQY